MAKNKIGAVAMLMAGIIAVSVIITVFTGITNEDNGKMRIVTSFYPMYIATLNVADGIDGVQVINLIQAQTGCLHDYQMSPDNMIVLNSADVLILNGAGAESFLDSAREEMPGLPVIDTSNGITLLENEHEHVHEEGIAEEHMEAYNEHIWASPVRYARQIQNLADGLCEIDPQHAEAYQANADAYLATINTMADQLETISDTLPYKNCLTFHDSLAYLADDLGLNVLYSISLGEESGVSASDLVGAQQAVTGKPVLFLYDSQYSDTYNEYGYLVKSASESQTLVLDVGVTGKTDKDAWLEAMDKTLALLEGVAK